MANMPLKFHSQKTPNSMPECIKLNFSRKSAPNASQNLGEDKGIEKDKRK